MESKSSYEWDLSPLTEGESFEKKRERIWSKVEEFESKWKGREDYLEHAKVLKEALDDYEELVASYLLGGDEGFYYYLRSFQDKEDSEVKAKYRKIDEFSRKCIEKVRFFVLNLSKVSKDKQRDFLDNELLKPYRHFLEVLFEKSKHLLSEEAENALDLKKPVSYQNWMDMTLSFIASSEREVLDKDKKNSKKSYSEIENLLKEKDSEIRNSAKEAFEDIISSHEKVAEVEINSLLENQKSEDDIRGYERPDKERHLSDDIDSEIVDSLIETVSENFDMPKRFFELKAKLLGFEKFEYEDRKIGYGKVSKELDFENAKDIVGKVLSNLDESFKEKFDSLVKNGMVDAFPRKGKESNAFCVPFLKNHPVYISLNYEGNPTNVKTFGHEIGHAIHFILMKESNNALNLDPPTSTAEVASTFMEDFVFRELIEGVSEEEAFVLKVRHLEDTLVTIFRQTLCYVFEQEIHKKYREEGYLSKERLGEIFSENMKKYLGDAFEDNEQLRRGWVYWPHIRYYFYTYSYSSGFLISKALQDMVKKDSSNIEKVKEFMKAGTSKSPKEIFGDFGIDITDKNFWREGLLEVREILEEVEAEAKKLGKI
ncbi:MAG: M3 family metallopeptidase [Candidatus Pacearchaeota archaeon]